MRDEAPRKFVPTDGDRSSAEAEFRAVAERLLPQLTDDEWEDLLDSLRDMRRRLRRYQFDQNIGYFY
ncbi:hypothetical protein CMK11_21985 [Candidatus Poribacteria bacterium]|nr:hypothetical protein [Candidatus Poribacteria bacterium]